MGPAAKGDLRGLFLFGGARLGAFLGALGAVLRGVARRRLEEPIERGDRRPRDVIGNVRSHLGVHEQGLAVRPRRQPSAGPEARDDLPVPLVRGSEGLLCDRAEAPPLDSLGPPPAGSFGGIRAAFGTRPPIKGFLGRGPPRVPGGPSVV